MAILKISEQSSGSQQAAEIARTYPRPLTLAELFLLGPGLKARLLLTSDSVGGSPWQTALMPLVNICAQLLWPRCSVPTFQGTLLLFLFIYFFRLFRHYCNHFIVFLSIFQFP